MNIKINYTKVKIGHKYMETIERRLELIKMMRHEEKENINRIQRREHILYPNRKVSYSDSVVLGAYDTKPYVFKDRYQIKDDIDSVSRDKNWGFYLRLIISITLFLTLFYMDISEVSYFGITFDMVQNMISDTFDLKSFAFMN